MGIRMDSIHAPTVEAGPTSGPSRSNGVDSNTASLFELMAEKDRVEAEIKALGEVLDSVRSSISLALQTLPLASPYRQRPASQL